MSVIILKTIILTTEKYINLVVIGVSSEVDLRNSINHEQEFNYVEYHKNSV